MDWQPIETRPKGGGPFLAAVLIDLGGGRKEWARHIVVTDESGAMHEDFAEEIRLPIERFDYWMPLPSPPTNVGEV